MKDENEPSFQLKLHKSEDLLATVMACLFICAPCALSLRTDLSPVRSW